MINPHKTKYHSLYWYMAYGAASQSVATRKKVGAIVVTPTGMISVGWNGTPPGLHNSCETMGTTNPEVIHAERNAIDKMTRQGVPTIGSILFTTTMPCFECSKAIAGLGLAAIYYDEPYKDTSGVSLLESLGVPIIARYLEMPA